MSTSSSTNYHQQHSTATIDRHSVATTTTTATIDQVKVEVNFEQHSMSLVSISSVATLMYLMKLQRNYFPMIWTRFMLMMMMMIV